MIEERDGEREKPNVSVFFQRVHINMYKYKE